MRAWGSKLITPSGAPSRAAADAASAITLPVTQMHAVEIAEGDGCALVGGAQRLPAMENLQGQFMRPVLEP